MRTSPSELAVDVSRAGERRADARLITLAAESAARLDRACADWAPSRVHALVFDVAFAKLRGELTVAEFDRLRARYERDPAAYAARLTAVAAH
jgi:hypothetical protein